MKILIDTNVVNEETFKLFDENNIIELVKRNKLTFYLSDILFGECIFANLSNDFIESKPLIEKLFKYSDDRIFAPVIDIINKEIIKSKGKYWFLPLVESQNLKNITFNKDVIDKTNSYYNKLKNDEKSKYNLLRQIIENEQLIISKSNNYSKKNFENEIIKFVKNLQLPSILEQEVTKDILLQHTNREKFRMLIRCLSIFSIYAKDVGSKMQNFTNFNSANYPYLNNYISATEYYLNYRLLEPDKQIDKNHRDNFYICYMKDCDILLSEDVHYMKDCLKYIYDNSKLLLTPIEFIDYLISKDILK